MKKHQPPGGRDVDYEIQIDISVESNVIEIRVDHEVAGEETFTIEYPIRSVDGIETKLTHRDCSFLPIAFLAHLMTVSPRKRPRLVLCGTDLVESMDPPAYYEVLAERAAAMATLLDRPLIYQSLDLDITNQEESYQEPYERPGEGGMILYTGGFKSELTAVLLDELKLGWHDLVYVAGIHSPAKEAKDVRRMEGIERAVERIETDIFPRLDALTNAAAEGDGNRYRFPISEVLLTLPLAAARARQWIYRGNTVSMTVQKELERQIHYGHGRGHLGSLAWLDICTRIYWRLVLGGGVVSVLAPVTTSIVKSMLVDRGVELPGDPSRDPTPNDGEALEPGAYTYAYEHLPKPWVDALWPDLEEMPPEKAEVEYVERMNGVYRAPSVKTRTEGGYEEHESGSPGGV